MKCICFRRSACGRVPERDSGRSFQCCFAKLAILTAAVGWFLAPMEARAVTYTYTKFSDLESVYADNGTPAWSSAQNIRVIGTVINNPGDMSDYSNYYINPTNTRNATYWQVFVQSLPGETYNGITLDSEDFGGAAAYVRVNNFATGEVYEQGNAPGQWGGEMDRLNYPNDANGNKVTESLRYGDVVMITAKAPGMHFAGKYNINEMHEPDPAYDFDITILARDTTPKATPITLADVKNGNDFIFDATTESGSLVATREAGCEHYQGSLVSLDDLTLVNTDSADWAPGKTVTVKQGNLEFPMLLGLDSALFSNENDYFNKLRSHTFDVTAIFDQEDYSSPFTGGYRLWLTNASGLTVVPEPSGFVLLAVAALFGLILRRRGR